MRNHLVEGFRRGHLGLVALVGAALLVALAIPVASASTHRRTSTTTKNPICSRLNKTIGLSAGADMYCLGPVRSSHAGTTRNSLSQKTTPKNVNSASPAEDVSPSGARAYGQSEESVGAVGRYVVEAWNDSTGFQSVCGAAKFKEELTGYGFSTDGGNKFRDEGGLPNIACASGWTFAGDPAVQGWSSGGHAYFYIQSLYLNNLTGASDIALDACTVTGTGASATLSCNSTPTIVATGNPNPSSPQFLDKDFLALDTKRGRLYATYSRFTTFNQGQAELAVCDISGAAAAHPTCYPGASIKPYFVFPITNPNCENEGAYPAVDPGTGEVYVAWEYNWATNFLSSACAGSGTPTQEKISGVKLSCLTLTAKSPCTAPQATSSLKITSIDNALIPGYNRSFPGMSDYPRIAVSDKAGTVTIVWNDGAKPTANILMQSWHLLGSSSTSFTPVQSHPVRLNNNGGATWVFMPGLRTANSSGKLDVVWYDRRKSSPKCEACTDLYAALQVSPTATKTPKTNARITNVSSNWNATSSDIVPNFGDYTDDLVVGKSLYIAWADGRLGVPQPFFAKTGG